MIFLYSLRQYLPITEEVGFLDAPARDIALRDQEWCEGLGRRATVTPLSGEIACLLDRLPVLNNAGNRWLLLPTRSSWTAYLDNFLTGTDASSYLGAAMVRNNCRSIRAVAAPDLKKLVRGKGKLERAYKSVMLEYDEPAAEPGKRRNRSIASTNDGHWVFYALGEPFGFEELDAYQQPKKQDRFTVHMLSRYLAHLGLHPFDTDFFVATKANPAYLVEFTPTWEVFSRTLEEAQQFKYGMVVPKGDSESP